MLCQLPFKIFLPTAAVLLLSLLLEEGIDEPLIGRKRAHAKVFIWEQTEHKVPADWTQSDSRHDISTARNTDYTFCHACKKNGSCPHLITSKAHRHSQCIADLHASIQWWLASRCQWIFISITVRHPVKLPPPLCNFFHLETKCKLLRWPLSSLHFPDRSTSSTEWLRFSQLLLSSSFSKSPYCGSYICPFFSTPVVCLTTFFSMPVICGSHFVYQLYCIASFAHTNLKFKIEIHYITATPNQGANTIRRILSIKWHACLGMELELLCNFL